MSSLPHVNRDDLSDHSGATTPLRIVFPALGLLLAMAWQRRANVGWALLMGVAGATGTLWSFDTGPVLLAALGALVAFGGDPARSIGVRVRDLGLVIGAAVSTLIVGLLILSAVASIPVSPLAALQDLSTFYLSGFMMLPIPLAPHLWMAAIMVSVIALSMWAVRVSTGFRSLRWERIALISILGVGLFSYYNGRSHAQVLLLACYPFVIVGFSLLDRGLVGASALNRWGVSSHKALTGVSLSVAVLSMALSVPALASKSTERWSGALKRPSSPILEDARYIAEHSDPPTPIGVVAMHQAALLIEADRRTHLPSLIEILTRDDADAYIKNVVDAGPSMIFIGQDILSDSKSTLYQTPWISGNFEQLLTVYDLVGKGPKDRLLMLKRRASVRDESAR